MAMTKAEILLEIRRKRVMVEMYEQQMHKLCVQAVDQGVSHTRVAKAVGIHRQSSLRRYGPDGLNRS